jgi:hypothetical protein
MMKRILVGIITPSSSISKPGLRPLIEVRCTAHDFSVNSILGSMASHEQKMLSQVKLGYMSRLKGVNLSAHRPIVDLDSLCASFNGTPRVPCTESNSIYCSKWLTALDLNRNALQHFSVSVENKNISTGTWLPRNRSLFSENFVRPLSAVISKMKSSHHGTRQ